MSAALNRWVAAIRRLAIAALVSAAIGCSIASVVSPAEFAEMGGAIESQPVAADLLAGLQPGEYRLGPGDELELLTLNHAMLAGRYRLDPDGRILLHPDVVADLGGKTRAEAEALLRDRLKPLYPRSYVSLRVTEFKNNFVTVLGRVVAPGPLTFPGRISLLQALGQAGVRPATSDRIRIERVAVIRGRDAMVWLDVGRALQRGDLSVNIPLASGDVVFVPDAEDRMVYVLGEVNRPGSHYLESGARPMRALADAGGFTEDADTGAIRIIRQRDGIARVLIFDAAEALRGEGETVNVTLQPEDIVYVPRSGAASFNYYVRQISPFTQMIILGKALDDD